MSMADRRSWWAYDLPPLGWELWDYCNMSSDYRIGTKQVVQGHIEWTHLSSTWARLRCRLTDSALADDFNALTAVASSLGWVVLLLVLDRKFSGYRWWCLNAIWNLASKLMKDLKMTYWFHAVKTICPVLACDKLFQDHTELHRHRVDVHGYKPRNLLGKRCHRIRGPWRCSLDKYSEAWS